MDHFVISLRDTNKEGRFSTGSGKPTFLRVPEGAEEPLPAHKLRGAREWFPALIEAATAQDDDGKALDIVFLVHGYNTEAKEAFVRQCLLERELRKRGFSCLVVGFDWPTGGTAAAYLYDRIQATEAALQLMKVAIVPFSEYQRPDCPIRVHLLAHSMGGYLVREACRMAKRVENWRLNQMVFFGADVSSRCFSAGDAGSMPMFDHCARFTNYFSGYDGALQVSNFKNVDPASRVGRIGLPLDSPPKALDVDCSARYAKVPGRTFKTISGMPSHSWYLEDEKWYEDLAYTLRGDLDRYVIPTRRKLGDNDFELIP